MFPFPVNGKECHWRINSIEVITWRDSEVSKAVVTCYAYRMTSKTIIFGFGVVLLASSVFAKEMSALEGYSQQIEITPLLKTTKTASGQNIKYPTTDSPEVSAVKVVIPPGAETGWHKHPYPCFGIILSGALTVEIEGGKTNVFLPGEVLVEVVDTAHNGINRGTEPVELIMFVTGEVGKPFTVRVPAPAS